MDASGAFKSMTPTPRKRRRTWLQRLLFGDLDEKYDILIQALEQNTRESKDLRKDLQEIAKEHDPLLKLVKNMWEARKKEGESGVHVKGE